MSDDLLGNLDLSKMTEAEIAEAKAIEQRAKELEKATSGHRDYGSLGLKIIAGIAILYGLFHLYTGFAGMFTALRQRSIHLSFALVICLIKFSANRNKDEKSEPVIPYIIMGVGAWATLFLVLQSKKALSYGVMIGALVVIAAVLFVARIYTLKSRVKANTQIEKKMVWYDFVFLATAIIGCYYIAINTDRILERAGIVMLQDQILGFLLLLTVLEATRRSIGHVLMFIGVAMLIYCRFGFIFPGVFWHPGFQISMIIRHFILTDSGLWSTPLGVSSSYISLFLLLGAALHATGLAELLLQIAKGIFGAMVGGPAKMAVVASSMFAMISGSSTSNVATTGIITIPLMKKTGIPPQLAGAIEASASMGGQITPPVMGAVAFIMAEFLGISYLTVILAAALPAALYYTAVFSMIHFESHKLGAYGLPKSELPAWKKDALTKGYLFIPVIVLVYMLVDGYTPMLASFLSFWIAIALSMLRKQTRLNIPKFFAILSQAGQTLTVVAIPSAIAGFVVGTATLTGLTPALSAFLAMLAQDKLILTLIITQVMCLVLGMGVPTVANYILMTIMTVPVMIKAGVPPLAAHLFCFHFGIMSELTPPVAITSYTASAIAGAPFWPTAGNAVRLAAVAYIVPYIFVYNTSLLLGQEPFTLGVLFTIIMALLGAITFGAGMSGFIKRRMYLIEQIITCIAAISIIVPHAIPRIIGVAVIGGIVAVNILYKKNPKHYVVPEKKPSYDA